MYKYKLSLEQFITRVGRLYFFKILHGGLSKTRIRRINYTKILKLYIKIGKYLVKFFEINIIIKNNQYVTSHRRH